MADAGIVRNGAKIDATIGNAAAFLDARRPSSARSTRISRRWSRAPPARLPPTAGVGRGARDDAGLGRAVGRPASGAASGSSARRSSTRSCRASVSSTTTSPAASGSRPARARAAVQRSRRSNRQAASPSTSAIQVDRPDDERAAAAASGRRTGWPWRGPASRPAAMSSDERRLETVDDAAPQAVAREQPAAGLGDRGERGRRRARPRRRPSRRPSSRARSATTAMAPGRDGRQDGAKGQGQRQEHERLAGEERDREERLGWTVARDERRPRRSPASPTATV